MIAANANGKKKRTAKHGEHETKNYIFLGEQKQKNHIFFGEYK